MIITLKGEQVAIEVDGKQISKMESIVTDQGDWVFGAKEHLAITQKEKWDEIPPGQRDTREVIQAAADARCKRIINLAMA